MDDDDDDDDDYVGAGCVDGGDEGGRWHGASVASRMEWNGAGSVAGKHHDP